MCMLGQLKIALAVGMSAKKHQCTVSVDLGTINTFSQVSKFANTESVNSKYLLHMCVCVCVYTSICIRMDLTTSEHINMYSLSTWVYYPSPWLIDPQCVNPVCSVTNHILWLKSHMAHKWESFMQIGRSADDITVTKEKETHEMKTQEGQVSCL
jgi:hypothetical protein